MIRTTLVAVALAACSVARSPASVPAGSAARARGVTAYVLGGYDAHAIELDLVGPGSPHLAITATGDETRQRLGDLELRATQRELVVAIDKVDHRLAHRADAGWQLDEPIAAGAQASLALLAAVDIDIAVQGSSIIWGGDYVQCTAECVHAASCTSHALTATCAQALDRCAGCMEQAP